MSGAVVGTRVGNWEGGMRERGGVVGRFVLGGGAEALRAPGCNELLDYMKATCWTSAHHEPSKFRYLCCG